jgi:hypothetical protein
MKGRCRGNNRRDKGFNSNGDYEPRGNIVKQIFLKKRQKIKISPAPIPGQSLLPGRRSGLRPGNRAPFHRLAKSRTPGWVKGKEASGPTTAQSVLPAKSPAVKSSGKAS